MCPGRTGRKSSGSENGHVGQVVHERVQLIRTPAGGLVVVGTIDGVDQLGGAALHLGEAHAATGLALTFSMPSAR